MTAPRLAATATLSVCAGRTCIGFLLSRGKLGFEAFDRDEHSLGIFPTMKLAAAAVSIAARAFHCPSRSIPRRGRAAGSRSRDDRTVRHSPSAACLPPVLDEYAVGFRVMHGFSGATTIHDVSQDDDGRELIVLYVGDFDPSGMFMSEVDLPKRLSEYGGDHITLRRIALTRKQVTGLPSFPVTDKQKDPRYGWFVRNYGARCWELDAMDPNDLRDCVEAAIVKLIEPEVWKRCEIVNRAEQESLKTIIKKWGAA
jgi:hypothetical protein